MTTLQERFTPIKERWQTRRKQNTVHPQKVAEIVCNYFSLDIDRVMGRRRYSELCFARFIIYKIVYRHCKFTQEQMGEIFGFGRTSVIYGITALTGWMDVYPEIKSEFENIEKIVLNEVRN